MIENFSYEVSSKLESDEIIEKSFEARNYDIIEQSPDISVGPYAFITTEDYSFKYSFIITNKRVFVGNMNPSNIILSYKIYNREDIINIDDFIDKKKLKLRYIYYIGGLIMLPLCISLPLSNYFPNIDTLSTKRIIALISVLLSIGLIYILSKVLNKFIKPNKLAKEISLKDGKKLTIILNDTSVLDCLKTQS